MAGRVGTASTRIYRAEAVVLRRLSIGETDRVATLFTRNRGKLNVIAKAARTPDVLARAFELHAMGIIGYEPSLYECVLNKAPVDLPDAAFHPLRGGMLCPRCARSTPGGVHLGRGTLPALRALTEGPLI